MKGDIQNRKDIDLLVRTFYEKLLEDRLLATIFRDVARIRLSEHLPVLGDFWESTLFHLGTYRRNTMEIHLELHRLYPLKKEHFDQWQQLFVETVDELFTGEKAILAKQRAHSIALLMQVKINNLERDRMEREN